jgi:hypothetical protein
MKPSNFQNTLYVPFIQYDNNCLSHGKPWVKQWIDLRCGMQCVAKLNTVKQVKQAGLRSEPQLPKWPSGHQMASLHFSWLKKRFSCCMAVQYSHIHSQYILWHHLLNEWNSFISICCNILLLDVQQNDAYRLIELE